MPRPSGVRRWKRGSANSVNGIRDEVVRRYYRQDLAERLQRTFAPEGGRGGYGRGNFRGAGGGESGRAFCPPQRLQPGPGRPIRPPGRARAGGGRQPRDLARPLPGGQSPACDQPDHARPAQRHVPPRGADPAVPDQPPLAPARPSGGSGRPGTGPSARPTSSAPALSQPSPTTITIPLMSRSRPRKCGPISKRAD